MTSNLKLLNVPETFKFDALNLSASLRSTKEISKFADSWMKFFPSVYKDEAEIKTSHNYPGDKPDIRLVSQIQSDYSDFETAFVQNAVSVIQEYLKMTYLCNFLPVAVDIPSTLLDRIQSELIESKIQTQRGFVPYSWSSAIPSVCFFNFEDVQMNNVEFRVMVVLLWINISENQRNKFQTGLLSLITRATIKLAIVQNAGYTNDNIKQEEEAQNTKIRLELEKLLKYLESGKSLIVGTIYYNFMPFKLITHSNQLKIRQPKIKGINLLEGPGGDLVFQLHDVYKKEHLEELIKCGITRVLILGDVGNFHFYTVEYFWSTYLIFQSDHFANQFEVHLFHANVYHEFNYLLRWNQFLREQTQNKLPNQMELAAETLWTQKTQIPSSGPSSRWKKWKSKATEFNRLKDPFNALKLYQNIAFYLSCEITMRDEKTIDKKSVTMSVKNGPKQMAKLLTNNSEIFLNCMSAWTQKFMDANREELSLEFCGFYAISYSLMAIWIYPFWHRSYELIREIRTRIANDSFNENDSLLEKLIEQDMHTGAITGLRGENFEWSLDSDSVAELKRIDEQRLEYKKSIMSYLKSLEIIGQRKELARCLADFAQKSLMTIEEDRSDTTDILEYWIFKMSSLINLNDFSIRCALEALEWLPNQKFATDILSTSLLVLTEGVSEAKEIAKEIGEQQFFKWSARRPIAPKNFRRSHIWKDVRNKCLSTETTTSDVSLNEVDKKNKVNILQNSIL